MNFSIAIYKEATGLTGYKTIKRIAFVTRDEGITMLESAEIVRRYNSPFDSSVECVVIK